MTTDRTFIIEGGPEKSRVDLAFGRDHSIDKFVIHQQEAGLGQIKIREIAFEEKHKFFYISDEVKITPVKSTTILIEN